VATVAGVIGTLVGTEGDRAAIEIAPGVIVEFLLAAITRTIEDPPPPLDGAAGDLDVPVDGLVDGALDEHGGGPLDGHATDDPGDHTAGLTGDDGHEGGQIDHDSGDAVGDDVGDDEAHRAAGQPAPRHEES